MEETIQPLVGQQLYGYCQGYFGRDSYDDKRIECVGVDYVVTRNTRNEVELLITTEWEGKIPKIFTIEEEQYD